ncbi:unnamed protein product [Orchesella dallaii]|uniref:ABC transporter G family member 20 n=1 Tax=Orchesella dallaii TaxID=48710 RepID=A0ABP1R2T8_9HEXA
MSFNELPETPRGSESVPNVRMEDRQDAVSVKHAYKSYGKGEQVLSNLTMTVKEGTIYTLLGSSGCGKTTLLSSIVGMTELDKGEVEIFGHKPGTKACGIPGKKIGYMPQEIALYGEFTIREVMSYFGVIHGMDSDVIEDRRVFLTRFLNLPKGNRYIRNLSGGQQRRVSFATALLHEPRILILDEPTVGVDPLLRRNIWQHLLNLAETRNTTVLITTHYIEEAAGAHRIGLMRNGRLLAEDSPRRLLHNYGFEKLEDVFFKLCQEDKPVNDDNSELSPSPEKNIQHDIHLEDAENLAFEVSDSDPSSNLANNDKNVVAIYNERNIVKPNNINDEIPNGTSNNNKMINGKNANTKRDSWAPFQAVVTKHEEDETTLRCRGVGCYNRMRALFMKNFLCMWRNISFVFFVFCLPAIQAALFCAAIGGQPRSLPFGVVNYEVGNPIGCYTTAGCSLTNMSCNFLQLIPNETLKLHYFNNEKMAHDDALQGKIWGYLLIPSNFSESVIQTGVNKADKYREDSFLGTHMKLALDLTSQQIAYTVQHVLSLAFQNFNQRLSRACGSNDTIDLPKSLIAEPIYGSIDSTFREFMAPGIILSIIFFMSVALTGSAFITEKKEGMLNRTLISGVSTGEIITAHMITQYIVMAGQTLLVLLVMIFMFEVEIKGSTFLAIALTLAQGTCGMAYGFLISVFCTEERNAIQMALGSFYPNLLLSGVVWPFESMPVILRQIAMFLPQTMACEAMRSIFSRGWGFMHPKVWPGFAVSLAWSLVFWGGVLILARYRKK